VIAMASPSIFRARALQRRQHGGERPPPPLPIPSARAVWISWLLLGLVLAGLAALGSTIEQQLEALPEVR